MIWFFKSKKAKIFYAEFCYHSHEIVPMTSLAPEKRDVAISKALSYLLRHGAVKEKLAIDDDGYVNVNQLLNHNRLKTNKATLEDIYRIVENNDKKRFTIRENDSAVLICASQGHSIESIGDSNLVQLSEHTMPKEIYHGTYLNKLPVIIRSGGLSRMGRNHIHFASNISNISGIRASCNVLIYLNVEKCLQSGMVFYKSSNNVILTSGDENGFVKVDYFDKVMNKKNDTQIDLSQYV